MLHKCCGKKTQNFLSLKFPIENREKEGERGERRRKDAVKSV